MHLISHIRPISSAMRSLSGGSAARQGPASATRSGHWETGGLELLCIAFPFVAAASRSLLVPSSASPPAASHSWRVMFCRLGGRPNSAASRWSHFDARFADLWLQLPALSPSHSISWWKSADSGFGLCSSNRLLSPGAGMQSQPPTLHSPGILDQHTRSWFEQGHLGLGQDSRTKPTECFDGLAGSGHRDTFWPSLYKTSQTHAWWLDTSHE